MALTPTNYTTGTAASYDLITGIKQDVDELILMLDPTETPLLNGSNYNGLPGALLPVGSRATQKKVEWEEETILIPYANSATTIGSGITTVVLTAADQKKFQVGDLVACPSGEILRVVAYNGTTSLDVTRAWGTTPAAATITTGDTLRGLGPVLTEGSAPGPSRVSDIVMPFNMTQIFGPSKMSMTETDKLIVRWGIPDQMAHQLGNRVAEAAIQMEQTYVQGVRTDDTTNRLRSMGGIDWWIGNQSGTTDTTTTALTAASINTNLILCYANGHTPRHLLVSPARLTTLNDFTNTSIVREAITDGMRGRQPATFVRTDYGDVQIIRSRYVPLTRAYLVTFDGRISRRIMRPMQVSQLAVTGDSQDLMFVAEETLQVKGAVQFCRYTGLTTA